MRSRFVVVTISTTISLILVIISSAVKASPVYLDQLINDAQRKQLDHHPYWHKLLHYQPDLVGRGVTSLVDSPEFFVAETGKTDPKAELVATLRLLLANEFDKRSQQPTACRFIARVRWLDEQLHFDHDRLSVPRCERFDTWLQRVNPQGMTLIFPTAYMNNPSSMFGHTLLRIDVKGQTKKTRLLAYSVNFAANTGNDGGVLFTVKGLMGGYPGVFSVAPYYLKVREYNDLENRDIWEYQLDFSTEETRRMLMHLWELRSIYFNYFFFDENCSYQLLALVQTARPGLDLTGEFKWFAIPSDTVKRVVAERGLVRKVTYRPSRFAELKTGFSQLSAKEIDLVDQLASGKIKPNQPVLRAQPPQIQAELLELSYELLNYHMQKDGDPTHVLEKRGQQLLLARSNIDVITPEQHVEPPEYRPDQGHGSSKASVAVGTSDNDSYLDLQYRPAYHDLLDPDAGYLVGAQIKFFDTVVRFKNDHWRLDRFTAVDIFSLTPRSKIQQSFSFNFNAGVQRLHISKNHQPLVMKLNGGMGMSWKTFSNCIFYMLLETTLNISGKLEDNHALGAGPEIGIINGWNTAWKSRLSLDVQRYAVGAHYTQQYLGFELQRSLGLTSAIQIGINRQYQFGRYWTEGHLSWQKYF